MRTIISGSLLVISTMISAPSFAVDKANQIGGSGVVHIDPSKAYIAFRLLQKNEFRFLRLPSAEERAAYDATRARELAQAREKHPGLLESEFDYPPIEMQNFINTNMGPVFDKQDGLNVYLIAVKPGTYILYGHLWSEGNDDAATCFCMGTVKFEAAAGKIVDLGRLRLSDDWDGPALPANPAGIPPFAVIPLDAPLRETGRLQGLPVETADLHAAGKMPNYFGALIDRLPAIPGVLDYDRDRVIDVKVPKETQ